MLRVEFENVVSLFPLFVNHGSHFEIPRTSAKCVFLSCHVAIATSASDAISSLVLMLFLSFECGFS